MLVELGGVRLLTDPVLRVAVAHLRRAVPALAAPAGLDAALVSHLHRDHLDLPSLRRLRDLPLLVVPVGARRTLRHLAVPLSELTPGDELMLGPIAVRAARAVHDGRRTPVSRTIESLGYLIDGRLRIYFAGDTELFDGMAQLAPVDVALLPVAGWGPSLGPGHMDAEQAARAAALLRAKIAIPIHWGTFAPVGLTRGRDRLLRDPPQAFAEHAARLAPGTRVEILQPGESLALT